MSTNRVFPGEIVKVKLPYSEVCMHMRVAGKVMWVQLRGVSTQAVAQLYSEKGGKFVPFSAPILPGEAGLYSVGSLGSEFCIASGCEAE